jgi:N-acetylneuraminic acid mutarotase
VEGVVIGEKIYIPGGETVNGKPTDILEIYDPRQDTWETGAPLPQPLSAYALADFEGKMYLFGGWDGEEPQDSVYIFDPSINSWCEGVPMLHKAYNVMAAVSDGKIFVVGGTDGETHFNIANAYLPNRDNSEENPWVTVSNIPYFLCQSIFGMEEMGDLIILIAPTDKHTYIFMFYYPQQDQWIISSEIKSELFPLYSSSVSIQGYLYLFGGVDADGTISYAVSRYQGLFITAFPNVSQ